jgi:hypothetical protein
MTPFSPNESGENIVAQHQSIGSSSTIALSPSESPSEATGHELQLSDTSDWSASFDQMAEADVSDVYIVGFAPMDSYEYYLIDADSSESLALSDGDTYYLLPVDFVALIESDTLAMSQEDSVSTVLSEAPVFDTAEVG